jgi:hypothetical protein
MTDELRRLDAAVPDELRQLQKELDGIDRDRLEELIRGTASLDAGEDSKEKGTARKEARTDKNKTLPSPVQPSLSSPPKSPAAGSASCTASAAPHFALGNAPGEDARGPAGGGGVVPMYCQEVGDQSGSGGSDGKPRQRRTRGAKERASEESAPSGDKEPPPPPTGARAAGEDPRMGVMYPYDPAVAELRALMKASEEAGDSSSLSAPIISPPSRSRVLRAAPPTALQSVNWVLVGAFAIVWATVVALMSRRSRAAELLVMVEGGLEGEEADAMLEAIQIPAILR